MEKSLCGGLDFFEVDFTGRGSRPVYLHVWFDCAKAAAERVCLGRAFTWLMTWFVIRKYLCYFPQASHAAVAQTDGLWGACQSWSYECWDTVCLQANLGEKAREEPKAAACARNYLQRDADCQNFH